MGAHAFIAPSGMPIGVHCSYFFQANAAFGSGDTLATEEGTAAHWVVEQALLEFKATGSTSVNFDKYVNAKADNDVYVTEEMIGHAQDSFYHMVSLVKNQCNFDTMEIEGRVHMQIVHPTDCWGTLDFGFYDEATRTITIRDFKYGFGIVDEHQNYQLFLYMLGMIAKYPQAVRFDLGVCQPRPYHRLGPNRNWTGEICNTQDMFDKVVRTVKELQSGAVQTRAGNHCRYCPVQYKCEAFQRSTMNALDVTMPPSINELDNQGLYKLYSVLDGAEKRVKHLKTAISDTISAKIDSGERVAGLTIESKMGNSYWAVTDKKAIEVCKMLGIDNVATIKAKTPISVLNSLKKDDPRRESIEALLKRKQSSSQLMFDDGREAERVFGKN